MTDRHSRDLCPRCLIGEIPQGEALEALLGQWLEAIPEEQRTEDAQYRDRLARCKRCPRLSAGLCALCGCYVEYRAARASQRCPDVPGRW